MVSSKVLMIIPRLTGTMPQLDISNSAFQQSSGNQCLSSVHAAAIHVAQMFGFPRQVECLSGVMLHAKRKLERLNAGVQSVVDA